MESIVEKVTLNDKVKFEVIYNTNGNHKLGKYEIVSYDERDPGELKVKTYDIRIEYRQEAINIMHLLVEAFNDGHGAKMNKVRSSV